MIRRGTAQHDQVGVPADGKRADAILMEAVSPGRW